MTMVHKAIISRDMSVSVFDETVIPKDYATQIHHVEWQDRRTKRVIAARTIYTIRMPDQSPNLPKTMVDIAYELLSEDQVAELSQYMDPYAAQEARELHDRLVEAERLNALEESEYKW